MKVHARGGGGAVSPERAGRSRASGPPPDEAFPQIRVLLVDEHRLFREGLRSLLQQSPGLRVIDDACCMSEALAKALQLKPDVIVTAFLLPDGPRGALVRELRTLCPEIPVVVLTGHDAEEALAYALEAGAAGFVLKDASADLVMKAIHAVCAGEVWVQREAMKQVFRLRREPHASTSPKPLLSPRESEVLSLMARGSSTDEIATGLFISPSTVRVHIAGIFSKLQVRNRIEAVRRAMREGLVEA